MVILIPQRGGYAPYVPLWRTPLLDSACVCEDYSSLVTLVGESIALKAHKDLGFDKCVWCGKALREDADGGVVERYLNQYKQNGFFEDIFWEVPEVKEKIAAPAPSRDSAYQEALGEGTS